MDTLSVHGCLLSAWGAGLLLRGPAGVGKSRLALELVRAGQALVADDAPDLWADDGRVMGRCPAGFAGLMAVRPLGVIDLAQCYGPDALVAQAEVALVVDLHASPPAEAGGLGAREWTRLLGIALPCLQLSTQAGPAALVSLLDAACRDLRARRLGVDPLDRLRAAQRIGAGAPR